MQLEHSFTVPVGIEEAWKVLLDIERVAPCMPGAALDTVHGDDFTGTVKVKLGPIGLTYKGKASFVEKDAAAHRAVISAQGRDARGNGTASARVSATLTEQGTDTKVDVITDLDITGKPAQFGRGVMVDVGNKLIGQFADCLAGKLGGGGDEAAPAAAPTPAPKPAAKKQPAKKSAPKPTPAPAASTPAAENAVAESAPAQAPVEAPAATPTESVTPAPSAEPTPAVTPSGPRKIQSAEPEPIDLLEHAGPAVVKRLAPVVAAVVLLLLIRRLRKR